MYGAVHCMLALISPLLLLLCYIHTPYEWICTPQVVSPQVQILQAELMDTEARCRRHGWSGELG